LLTELRPLAVTMKDKSMAIDEHAASFIPIFGSLSAPHQDTFHGHCVGHEVEV
jgi:hypothetical protein